MNKNEILNELSINDFTAFETMYGLDIKKDIFLANNSLKDFFTFCNSINNKIIFYNFLYYELEDYVIDEIEVKDYIYDSIEERIEETSLIGDTDISIKNFDGEIKKMLTYISKHNIEVKNKLENLKETEIFSAEIYTINDGIKVGVEIYGDYMDEYPRADDIKERIDEKINEMFEEYGIDNLSNYERFIKAKELKKTADKKKQDEALKQIREHVENDRELKNCSNSMLRHAYAKKIAEQYTEKFEVQITIASVEVVVEELYRKLKDNQK